MLALGADLERELDHEALEATLRGLLNAAETLDLDRRQLDADGFGHGGERDCERCGYRGDQKALGAPEPRDPAPELGSGCDLEGRPSRCFGFSQPASAPLDGSGESIS